MAADRGCCDARADDLRGGGTKLRQNDVLKSPCWCCRSAAKLGRAAAMMRAKHNSARRIIVDIRVPLAKEHTVVPKRAIAAEL
jgi:hypothetical protein